MEDDREDEELIRVDLDEETVAHYERRAVTAGRSSTDRATSSVRNGRDKWADAGTQIYSRQIVCSSSRDQNLSRDRHVLHRQPAYRAVACVRTGCHAGTWRHQHSGEGAAHSNGREQLAQCFFMG
jgi:hypothetical protein